jgi:signal transduction histidine kinase
MSRSIRDTHHDEIDRLISEMAVTSDLLTADDDLAAILQSLAYRARDITRADYAAISTFDEQGQLTRFIYAGIDDSVARRLGTPPKGSGLLGHLSKLERPLRVNDLTKHPESSGWPQGHPDMAAFIGVPIRSGGQTIGSFCVTRNRGKEPFEREAELAAAVLALQAGVSLASAFSRQRLGRLYLLEERERIAHDLHDGTIQSLYALGLALDATTTFGNLPSEVKAQLEASVDQINTMISDIRSYIAVLGSRAVDEESSLSRDLSRAVRQLVPPHIATVLNVTAAALQELSSRAAEDLLYVAREGISNAVRHGAPTKIAVDLRQTASETTLAIQDNGIGFDAEQVRAGLGTTSMRNRAERLGADLAVVAIPGMGTTVRLRIPRTRND